jgi:hypothetical protein
MSQATRSDYAKYGNAPVPHAVIELSDEAFTELDRALWLHPTATAWTDGRWIQILPTVRFVRKQNVGAPTKGTE